MSSEEKQGPVLVRSREGEEVTCSREAACRAVTLDNMIKDSADGICPVDLPVIGKACPCARSRLAAMTRTVV